MAPSITVNNLSIYYHKNQVISDISGQFKARSMTAVIGPNGSGKSTLIKSILHLHTQHHGSISFQDITAKDCAYLAQHTTLDRQFPLTVLDTVALGLYHKIGSYKPITPSQKESIYRAIKRVGLEGAEDKPLQALSGGQFQRVLFARLIMQDAPVILLDEPFTGVDEQTSHDLLQLITEWNQEGRLIICVLHDIDLVRRYFPQTLLMARRAIAWGPTEQTLHCDNLSQASKSACIWEKCL